MVLRGQTPKAVSEAAGVCPRTVRKWVKRFKAEGLAGLQDRSSPPQARAMVLHAMAEAAIRQGRTDDALARLDQAEAEAPFEVAVADARAEALSSVWRWSEAARGSPRIARATVWLGKRRVWPVRSACRSWCGQVTCLAGVRWSSHTTSTPCRNTSRKRP